MVQKTRQSLLEKVKEGDNVAWTEFYNTYKGLIIYIAGKHGLTQNDHAELFSLVLGKFFDAQKKFVYDRSKGKFRTYFGMLVRSCIYDLYRSRTKFVAMDEKNEAEILEEIPAEQEENTDDRDYREFLLYEGLKVLKTKVQEISYQAFILNALHGKTAEETAAMLSIPVSQVYNAKARLTKMLRDIVKELQEV